jgi:hypothetical protein
MFSLCIHRWRYRDGDGTVGCENTVRECAKCHKVQHWGQPYYWSMNADKGSGIGFGLAAKERTP